VVLLQLLDLEWFVMQAIADAKIGISDVGRARPAAAPSRPPAVQATSTALAQVRLDLDAPIAVPPRFRLRAERQRPRTPTTPPKHAPMPRVGGAARPARAWPSQAAAAAAPAAAPAPGSAVAAAGALVAAPPGTMVRRSSEMSSRI
jgi:hypothetical protein